MNPRKNSNPSSLPKKKKDWKHTIHDDPLPSIPQEMAKMWETGTFPKNMGETPSNKPNPTPSYYGKMLGGQKLDIYQILVSYDITNPAIAHAIKKLLRYGRGGNLSEHQDVQGALDSLLRWQEMNPKPTDMTGVEPVELNG